MKKLMMMMAACAAMAMGASAATPTITGAWLDGDSLGFTTSPSLGQFAGRSDEHLYIEVGNAYNGVINRGTSDFFEPLAYSGEYTCYSAWKEDWASVLEKYTDAHIIVCHYGDHGVDAATHVQIVQIGTMWKDAEGVWRWRGADGRTGIVGTEVPVVEEEDEDEEEDEVEEEVEEVTYSKCPVISFFQKLFRKR